MRKLTVLKPISILIRNAMIVATLKKENMELYKLNLPNGIINNIIDYSMDEEDVCRTCRRWRRYQNIIENILEIKKSMKEM